MDRADEFPLTPRPFEGFEPERPPRPQAPSDDGSVGLAVATYVVSAVIGLGGLAFTAPLTSTRGASRSAQLRKTERQQLIAEAERDACR